MRRPSGGRPFCATRVDSKNNYIKGSYGFCPRRRSCPIDDGKYFWWCDLESSKLLLSFKIPLKLDQKVNYSQNHAKLLQTVQIQENLVYFHSSFVVRHTLVSQIS